MLSAVVGAGERGALFSRTALAIGKQVFMEVRAKQRDKKSKFQQQANRVHVRALNRTRMLQNLIADF